MTPALGFELDARVKRYVNGSAVAIAPSRIGRMSTRSRKMARITCRLSLLTSRWCQVPISIDRSIGPAFVGLKSGV